MPNQLTLDVLKQAVAGSAAAFRRVVELQPAGGQGAKVFPPTYEGGRYATEKRRIKGETVDCVLLDSVQAQANWMELALQEALDEKRPGFSLPVITVDFSGTDASFIRKITSLQAPHRIADAILRDSEWTDAQGKKLPFRKSPAGAILDVVSLKNASPLFEYCPTALVFGIWDSTSLRKSAGLGVKFPRAIVSEIIGIGAIPGQRTSSRIDPLQISSAGNVIYKLGEEDWTLNPDLADKDEEGKPVKLGKNKKAGKPSSINHGPITPSLVVQKDDRDQPIKDAQGLSIPIGGYTIDRAQQTTVISLPTLRRLRFPVNGDSEANNAGRVALAALALCAATLNSEKGYNLRSQCDLYASPDSPGWEIVGGQAGNFNLDTNSAIALLEQATAEATSIGLKWNTEEIKLTPRADLVEMILRSRVRSDEPEAKEIG